MTLQKQLRNEILVLTEQLQSYSTTPDRVLEISQLIRQKTEQLESLGNESVLQPSADHRFSDLANESPTTSDKSRRGAASDRNPTIGE